MVKGKYVAMVEVDFNFDKTHKAIRHLKKLRKA